MENHNANSTRGNQVSNNSHFHNSVNSSRLFSFNIGRQVNYHYGSSAQQRRKENQGEHIRNGSQDEFETLSDGLQKLGPNNGQVEGSQVPFWSYFKRHKIVVLLTCFAILSTIVVVPIVVLSAIHSGSSPTAKSGSSALSVTTGTAAAALSSYTNTGQKAASTTSLLGKSTSSNPSKTLSSTPSSTTTLTASSCVASGSTCNSDGDCCGDLTCDVQASICDLCTFAPVGAKCSDNDGCCNPYMCINGTCTDYT